MKRIRMSLLIALIGVVHTAICQPTLTALNSSPVVGDTFVNHSYYTSGFGNLVGSPGASGANVFWSFLNLVATSSDTMKFVDSSTTPYCWKYNSANLASIDGTSFNYYISNADSFANLGYVNFDTTYLRGNAFKYPISLGTTYTENIYSHTIDYARIVYGTMNFTADAYGTLTLSSGAYSNAIRIHLKNHLIDSLVGNSVYEIWSDIYIWHVPGFHNSILQINYDSLSYGFKDTSYIYTTGSGLPTGFVNIGHELISLHVYPNPTSNEIHIKFLNTEDEKIHIGIYNVLGNEVQVLHEGAFGMGELEISATLKGLAPGLYFIRLQNNKGIVTKKIELIN